MWGGAMDNNQIVSRYDKRDLSASAQGKEATGRQLDRRSDAGVEKAGPPQIAVARAKTGLRIGLGALRDPMSRDELPVLPLAFLQVE